MKITVSLWPIHAPFVLNELLEINEFFKASTWTNWNSYLPLLFVHLRISIFLIPLHTKSLYWTPFLMLYHIEIKLYWKWIMYICKWSRIKGRANKTESKFSPRSGANGFYSYQFFQIYPNLFKFIKLSLPLKLCNS